MKPLLTMTLASVLMFSCKKNAYKCVCTTSNALGISRTSEYQIIETERKAKKICQSGSSSSGKNCQLH